MNTAPLLLELYGRIAPLARDAITDVDLDGLTAQPAPGANTMAWLIWHVARVQDHHISELLGTEQLWVEDRWARQFGLDPDPGNTGYGHSPEDMIAVRPVRPEALTEYLEAVDARTRNFLRDVADDDLDRIIDRRWDPPVTLAVRLVSLACDNLEHVGQAAYARGLLRS
jgi:uncharacterized damage-inducible protein DinB